MRLAIVTRAKPNRHSEVPLCLRIAHRGTRYVYLSLHILPKYWNARKSEVRKSHPHAAQLNRILAERLSTAEQVAFDVMAGGRHFTAEHLKQTIEEAIHPGEAQARARAKAEAEDPDFIVQLRRVIERGRSRVRSSTTSAYTGALAALERHARGPLRMSQVTARFVLDYEAVLSAVNKPNTVRRKISTLRTLTRILAREGVPGAEEALKALESVRLKAETAEKVRLTLEQVEAMGALDLSDHPHAQIARDAFLLAFYMGGLRRSEIIPLRWSEVDLEARVASWRQQKTGKVVRMPLVDPALVILSRWLQQTGPGSALPSPYVLGLAEEAEMETEKGRDRVVAKRGEAMNKQLVKIAERLGLPRFTMHAARHSLADHLRRSGVDVASISMTLGHSSIEMTQRYLSAFDTETVAAGMREALG